MPDSNSAASLNRPTLVRYRVLAFFCLAAAIAYLQRMSIGVANSHMQRDLALSDVQMGWVMSAFFWGYALFQIPAGTLGQRYGSRSGLTVAMAATSLLCGLVAICGDFWSLLIVWMGVGLAIAGIFPCCAQSIVRWYPPTERAMPSGFLPSAMSLGAMVAATLTGWLLSLGESPHSLSAWGNWRTAFALYAVPGLLWAILFGLWFRDRPEDHRGVNAAELQHIRQGATTFLDTAGTGRPTPWLQMLAHPTMLLICGQQFFRSAAYIFYGTWFPKFLREVYGFTTAKSGYVTSLAMLAVVLGGIVSGPMCDLILRRTGSHRLSLQLVGMLSQFICGLLFLLAWIVEDSTSAVALITVGSFVFAFGSCTAYAVTIHVSQPFIAPVFSTMNMSGNFGAAVCPVAVGWLVGIIGWQPILLFFVAIYALACLCWLGVNPDRGLFADERSIATEPVEPAR